MVIERWYRTPQKTETAKRFHLYISQVCHLLDSGLEKSNYASTIYYALD